MEEDGTPAGAEGGLPKLDEMSAGAEGGLPTRGAARGDIFARHLAAHQRIWN